MDIVFKKFSQDKDKVLIIPIYKDLNISELELDGAVSSSINKALQEQNYTFSFGETLEFNSFLGFKKIIVVSLDGKKTVDGDFISLGGKLSGLIEKEENASLLLSHIKDKELVVTVVKNLVSGVILKNWQFLEYFSDKEKQKNKLKVINLIAEETAELSKAVLAAQALCKGINFTKSLVNEPANILNSESFASRVKELEKLGVSVEVLNQKELEKLGMEAILSVNKASENEAKVVVMKYNNDSSQKEPLAFIGKGVTFDSGGLSIKPAMGMVEMKRDMAGAAVVCGLIKNLAIRKAKVNVIGVIGLVENMVSSKSMRPGDVIGSMAGKTIEVLNTDAEGRLLLADLLYYTHTTYKPKFMVNLATLTGAISAALGSERAGLFSNNDDLAEKLFNTGEKALERLWRFPVTDEYKHYLNSSIADISNLPNAERSAGSIAAAMFLKEFVGDTPWAHLDIAGVAWANRDLAVHRKGATAFGVSLLNEFLLRNFESK